MNAPLRLAIVDKNTVQMAVLSALSHVHLMPYLVMH